jgi:hypothetical protein
MGLPFRSRFTYDTDSELLMVLPITPWNKSVRAVGGDIESDAGVRASFVVRRDELLTFTLRFFEDQWPEVQAFIDFAQTGANFAWYPDQDDASAQIVTLEAPILGDPYAAVADGSYPRVLNLTITLTRPGGVPWELPDYINTDPFEDEEPPPTVPLTPGWVIHIFVPFVDNLVVFSGSGDAYVLIVGGGGSGGSVDGFGVGGGGGGGGEMIKFPDPGHAHDYFPLTPGTYPVIVGAGGNAPHADHTIAGGVFGAVIGTNGDDSSFGGYTAKGGGGGGAASITLQRRGKDGGSGGGGASSGDAGPFDGGSSTATDGYGEDGGDGTASGSAGGAGGGGANAPGVGPNGGAGIEDDISNVTGDMVEYGRGGDAINGGPGADAPDGTGQGGQGGGQHLLSDGGDGGDGCVIIKYRMETGIVAVGGLRTEYPD